MIDINEEKIWYAFLMNSGRTMEEAFLVVARRAYNIGSIDGYPDLPLDEPTIHMFFVKKLFETKSLDEAFLKAIWRAYEHKYTDDD